MERNKQGVSCPTAFLVLLLVNLGIDYGVGDTKVLSEPSWVADMAPGEAALLPRPQDRSKRTIVLVPQASKNNGHPMMHAFNRHHSKNVHHYPGLSSPVDLKGAVVLGEQGANCGGGGGGGGDHKVFNFNAVISGNVSVGEGGCGPGGGGGGSSSSHDTTTAEPSTTAQVLTTCITITPSSEHHSTTDHGPSSNTLPICTTKKIVCPWDEETSKGGKEDDCLFRDEPGMAMRAKNFNNPIRLKQWSNFKTDAGAVPSKDDDENEDETADNTSVL